jgi:hypothetical protein
MSALSALLFVGCAAATLRAAPQLTRAPMLLKRRHCSPRLVAELPTKSVEADSFLRAVEDQLLNVFGDRQAVLEAVVGLPDSVATYDRARVVSHFVQRPSLMVGRGLEFLSAYRRVRSAWFEPDGSPSEKDRGAVLRAELSTLGPVAVKIGQTLSQRPDILPADVCEALKGLQMSNTPFPDTEAFAVMAEEFNATGPLAPGVLWAGCDPALPPLFAQLSSTCVASASLGQV